MTTSLLNLALKFEAASKNVESVSSQIAQEAAVAIVTDLAFKTPVDTSQARSNWQVGLNAPMVSTIGPHFPGRKGSTGLSSAAETIAVGKMGMQGKRPGSSIFITNNLHYIADLNNGTSAQEPAGFVERAIVKGRLKVANTKLKVFK